MLEIVDLINALGLSRAAVYNRLEVLKAVLADQNALRRGANNRVLVTAEGLQLLRALEDKHSAGMSLADAASQIRDDLGMEAVGMDDSTRRIRDLEIAQIHMRNTLDDLESRLGLLELKIEPEARMIERRSASLLRRAFRRISGSAPSVQNPPKAGETQDPPLSESPD